MLSFESFYVQSLLLEYAKERHRISYTKHGNEEVYHLDTPGNVTPDSTVIGVISDHRDTTLQDMIAGDAEWTSRHVRAAVYAVNVRPMDREKMMHLFRYKLVNDPLNGDICTRLSNWAVQQLADLLIERSNQIKESSPNTNVIFVRPESRSAFNSNVEQQLHGKGVLTVSTLVAIKKRMADLHAVVDEMRKLMGPRFVDYMHSENFANISHRAFSRDALATDYVASRYTNKNKLSVLEDLKLLQPATWNMFRDITPDINSFYLLYDDNFSKGFTVNHLRHVFKDVPESRVEYYAGLQVIGRRTTDELDAWEHRHLTARDQQQQIRNTLQTNQASKVSYLQKQIKGWGEIYQQAMAAGDREKAREAGKAYHRFTNELQAIEGTPEAATT